MKRASIFIPGILILCLQSLYAGQGGSNLNGSPQAKGVPTSSNAQLSLTLQDVIHSSTVIAPGIRALSWRPGTKQLTFLRPPGNGGPYTLSAYDVESHRETVLFDSAAGKQQLDLHSYQWSPRGDVILLEGDNDLWLLDPQTHGLRRLTHDGVAKEVPAFSPAGDRIAFVEKHDLYVVDAKSGAVRGSPTTGATRFTTAGSIGFTRRSWPTALRGAPSNGRRTANASRICGLTMPPSPTIPSPIFSRPT